MPPWESGMTAWPVGVHLPTGPRFGSGGDGGPGTDPGRPKTLGGCTLSQFRAEMQRITRSQQRIFCAPLSSDR